MRNIYLLLFFVFSTSIILGQKIAHEVAMPHPETHYFQIQTELSGFKENKITLVMPVWSPGSYLIREYPNNVNNVVAKNENGELLKVRKTSKNKWEIEKGKAKKVKVTYESYAFDLTVRTAFLDAEHGFFNGTNIFTFPEGYQNLGGTVKIIPAATFSKISTPLPEQKDGFSSDDGAKTFVFEDFDELADTPFEIGNQTVFEFEAAGVKHKVAMYGEGNYEVETLQKDMAKVVEASTSIFGQNPNKEYLFIIHNTDEGGGGLEHANSTTLNVNRWTYKEDSYRGFLSLVAHEYFHVWNVKRLRPTVFVNYDYSNENYTDLLWVMEGFTSYYSELILRRAGFYTQEGYLRKLQSTLNYVEGMPGNKVQSVSQSSYDAWIKAYRTNENSRNTTVSYYSKGGLIGSLFDALIIAKYKGEKDLADFMQLLYKKYYTDKFIGITQEIVQKELSAYLQEDMSSFFEKYIDGTETLPYAEIFEKIGVEVEYTEQYAVTLGVSLAQENGKIIVKQVEAGSQAEIAGLSVNDEIIAFNSYRLGSAADFTQFLNRLNLGDEFNILLSREGKLKSIDAVLGTLDRSRYAFKLNENKLNQFWLREIE